MTVWIRRLAWAFAGRLCDKYHKLMCLAIIQGMCNIMKVSESILKHILSDLLFCLDNIKLFHEYRNGYIAKS